MREIPNFSRASNTFYDELVLSENKIEEIRTNAFQGIRVKRLHLSGNRIRSISSDAFRELANYLEELTIEFDDQTKIQEIPRSISQNLRNLRRLTLINLRLEKLEHRMLMNLRKLEHLSIMKSNLIDIERNTFDNLTNLRCLILEGNRLNSTGSFESLIDLESLILAQNHLKTIEKNAFSSLKHLKTIDLSSNGLQTINSDSFPPSIEEIHLQNNELNSLQLKFVVELKHLHELNLDFNRLTFVPEKIFQNNAELLSLSMQGNDLNSIGNSSFIGLKSLTHLNLARNRIEFEHFEKPFSMLTNLKSLNLDRNVEMNLTSNNLIGLETNLQEFSLQNCQLKSIDGFMSTLKNLQRLKLSSNQIETISSSTLSNSRSTLISVDLQRNRLISIPKLFVDKSSIIDFDVSSNQISRISRADLSPFSKLKTLGLAGNPLNCDCHLRWIKRWLEENYDRDLIKFLQWICQKPSHLQGKQITKLNESAMLCSNGNLFSMKIRQIDRDGNFNVSWRFDRKITRANRRFFLYDQNQETLLTERTIFFEQTSLIINLFDYRRRFSTTYVVCLQIQQEELFCQTIRINSNKDEIYLYVLVGILFVAVLVSCLLIYLCYASKNDSINDKRSSNAFYYSPLKITTYPVMNSQETSDCSLHSSTMDPYHFYQKITSLQRCQIHRTDLTQRR